MTNGDARLKKSRGRLWVVLAVVVLLMLALVVPPLISVSHYKSQITHLMAQSLGRPVRLSSVEVRLLPWPGFVLYDLSVAEDPAYGAEPVLHASEVTASLRLLALWRGRLEIDKISVDDASLNLVRAGAGRWNLDPIFRTAAAQTGVSSGLSADAGQRRGQRLPSLEATNLRIHFKNGAEKLPFSLLNADLSFWQESPGEWRIRLRGQPARTDVSLYQEETGTVRMEASVRSAPALRE
ncbi:MAG: AsmA family protein, partial [Terracidiphilus sp.]